MFRITQKEQALQRAAVLQDLRILSERKGMTDTTRKQLHDGYSALVTYWTGINEMEASKFRTMAQKYADKRNEDAHRCTIL